MEGFWGSKGVKPRHSENNFRQKTVYLCRCTRPIEELNPYRRMALGLTVICLIRSNARATGTQMYCTGCCAAWPTGLYDTRVVRTITNCCCILHAHPVKRRASTLLIVLPPCLLFFYSCFLHSICYPPRITLALPHNNDNSDPGSHSGPSPPSPLRYVPSFSRTCVTKKKTSTVTG